MKTLEAKPFDQNAENWKRENRLFISTVLEAGASGQNRIGTPYVRTHSEVIKQFDSFSMLNLLFLVRNRHCWSRKAFPRQMTPQSREKTAKTAVFRSADRHEKLYGRSRLYASAQGRHETGGVLSLFSRLSFDISIKNSVRRWSSDFQGLFRVKIRKMAQGSDDLSTLPLSLKCDFFENSHPPKRILFVSLGFCELLRWSLTVPLHVAVFVLPILPMLASLLKIQYGIKQTSAQYCCIHSCRLSSCTLTQTSSTHCISFLADGFARKSSHGGLFRSLKRQKAL